MVSPPFGKDCPVCVETSVESLDVRLQQDPELLRRFGITRLGDVTGLDIVGIPVWFASRPNSRGLSVSQGKGLTTEMARTSAFMEAVEGAVAEDAKRHVSRFGSIADMAARNEPVVPLDKVGRVDLSQLSLHEEHAWVRGVSLRTDHEVLAPFELIGLDFRADFPWDRRAFHMSSQGIAAGFDFDKTVLHALLELVENDACALIDTFQTRNLTRFPVELPEHVNSAFDDLVRHVSGLGLPPRFYNLTNELNVPVIMAGIERSVVSLSGPGIRHSAGIACRLDIHDAALAALLEAIQSRLTDISGARDDLQPERYMGDVSMPEGSKRYGPSKIGSLSVEFTGDIKTPLWKRLATHLFKRGIDDVFVFRLETGVPGLHVVRVLASGLGISCSGLQQIMPQCFHGFINGWVNA
ncbi:MAG: YcaO-like family protein [Proteobacteria bacterium]|nr:YcaO-like family protein [Pseudomonadota bacterium]